MKETIKITPIPVLSVPKDEKPAAGTINDLDSPQTGDNSNIFLWIALLFASGAGIMGITVYRRKKNFSGK